MNSKLCYIAILGTALTLTSCGKKLGQFSSDYFSVNPNPLELVGENVPGTVTGKIPANFFVKNAQVTVTPYLVFNGTEVASQPYTFQGEKVRGNNPVVSYEYGGTVTIPVNYAFQPEMAKSELELAFQVSQGSKEYVLPRVKVATGVIATAALADAATVTPAVAPDAFQRVINEKYAADIMFLINQANVRANQLNTDAMTEFKKELANANSDTARVIKEINISSYASPEGALDFNTRLAEQREKNTGEYLAGQLKKDKITEFGELTSQFTAEDWDGFQKLVSKSDIQDKDLILSVLSMYKDPEQREREIRNLSSVFEQLADQILPQLRYSRLTASIDVIGKSDAEISRLAATDAKQLSVEELLYAATLTDDNARRMSIYKAATEQYPNDYRAWNDLGLTQYRAGDYAAAKASFEKAAALDSKATEPMMNLGLIQMVNGNYDRANQYFGSAAGVDGLGEALGVYYLKKGDNAAAARAFGDSKSNNAALAQILTKDYSKAKQTLAGITTPDATTYYLMAVLGARTNNESMLTGNLRQAVKLDSSLATKAANDLEFANFDITRAIK
ncbi:MAG: tetratricopeptide repeat protein [Muribaculaceae bacterium]